VGAIDTWNVPRERPQKPPRTPDVLTSEPIIIVGSGGVRPSLIEKSPRPSLVSAGSSMYDPAPSIRGGPLTSDCEKFTHADQAIAVQTECELVQKLVTLLPARFASPQRSFVIEREVSVGRASADIVLLSGRTHASAGTACTLNITESVIVSHLRRFGPIRIDSLERLCGFPPKSLRNGVLDRLQDLGIVRSYSRGYFRVSRRWGGQSDRIIAIEAKLEKWRRALSQAVGYRRYADHVYVALPAEYASPALQSRPAFRSLGVGLLVSTANSLRVEVKPRLSRDHDWQRDFVYSRLLAASAGSRGGALA
jgi:hypothetical protein